MMRRLVYLSLVLSAFSPAVAAGPDAVLLKGEWLLRQLENDKPDIAALAREAASPGKEWMRTKGPVQVHEALIEKGLIPDPRVSKNNAASAWVGTKDWAYACVFASPARSEGPAVLRFRGLDTLAKAYLNGAPIGEFANMYREYAVDVKKHLAPAGRNNTLLIVFSAPLRFIEQYPQPKEHAGILPRHKYLRKSHSDFSSYLGAAPHSVKVGPYRNVELWMYDRGWLEDVWVRPKLAADHKEARLLVRVERGGAEAGVRWRLADPAGAAVAGGENTSGSFEIPVQNPKLWWPRTHGTPQLYTLQLELVSGARVLDGRLVKVGIRDVRPVLTDPATGEKRFRFDVNGKPVFMRGACWAPVEGLTHAWRSERARTLLDLAEQANMNILRVWGEGVIPEGEFYDECDRRGIFVWQDFMFGYGMHPAGEPGFNENCRAEIEGMIRRLRNHPSILLWVGGNENHMGIDFAGVKTSIGSEIFLKMMPEAVARLDPDRHFHPSSPYGGRAPNWPLEGDWHDYTTLTFSPEASVPAFASEVGRASAPSLTSMKKFLAPEELWPAGWDPAIRVPGKPAWPPMWQYRSVGGSWDKVGPVERYVDAKDAEGLIRALGTAHGEYLRERVERERRGTPDGGPAGNRRCWGNMIWRLNDAWPILYWSAIDYYLEPKIPYYFLKRAYEPVQVSVERTADRMHVWVVNDSPEPVTGELVVKRMRFDGRERGEMRANVAAGPAEAKRAMDLTDYGPISLREEFLLVTYAGKETTYLLTAEKYLKLPAAKIAVRRAAGGVEVTTDNFARQVTLEVEGATGAVFEDNFLDMRPGEKRAIKVRNPAGGRWLAVKALNAESVRLSLED